MTHSTNSVMTMELPTQMDITPSDPSLHPFKRRKCYRKRAEIESLASGDDIKSESNDEEAKPLTLDELIIHHGLDHDMAVEGDEDSQFSAAQILRQLKAVPKRRGGIEFTIPTVNARTYSPEPEENDHLKDKDTTTQDIKTVVDRFAPQTGQVADVDKHMMAYIDSELAKRRQGHGYITSKDGAGQGNISINGTLIDAGLNRQPATLGKLHEIDLGPDATLRNIARTEAAKRRLEDGDMEEEGETGKGRRRDGKPWRGRRRRNSEDIKRDKIVEEVMREGRLEIYDELEQELPNDDQAADDRIAEQFRRDFMDAISSRRQRSSAAAKAARAKANGQKKADDRPRGPKLGGSRSARAAMREAQAGKAAKK